METGGAFRSKLTKGTVIPVVWSRGLPSAPTSVRVYRKPNGKWFASFVVETKPEDDMPHTGNAVGIDWGGRETATTATIDGQGGVGESEDFDMPFGDYERKYGKSLAEAQRRMARRYRKGKRRSQQSRGHRKALRQYNRLKRRSAAQRKDTANKWARKAQDAAIGKLIDTLEWQAVKHGRRFVEVNPACTTQDCSNCGARAKRRLGSRDSVYRCERCGLVLDRDGNSAVNMLIGAGSIPRPMGTSSRGDAAVHGRAVPEKGGISRL